MKEKLKIRLKERASLPIQQKLLLAYLFLAVIPMLVITIYTYRFTQRTLIDSMEQSLETDLEWTVRSLDEQMNGYDAVLNIFYTDKTLHNYLSVNYTNRGYQDLFYYVSQTIDGMNLLYPDIQNIEVYSTNETLFHDEKYLYGLDRKEFPEWGEKAVEKAGMVTVWKNVKENTFYVMRYLNLYETGSNINIAKLEIPGDKINSLLIPRQNDTEFYLVDEQKTVIAGSEEGAVNRKFEQTVDLEDADFIVLQREIQHYGTLYLVADKDPLNRQARQGTIHILLISLVSAGLAISCIYIYSVHFKKNVENVMNGARKIGEGDFSYKITNVPRDEMGDIANSVNQMGEQLRELIEESYQKELERRRSELNLLQEQINPHFLYNALSSISSIAMKNGNMDVTEAIASLADFYRISLNKGRNVLTIREELKLLESYLKVQRMRFGDSIVVEYELDDSLLDDSMIKLLLQPVVENAIHHGRDNTDGDFHIVIRLYKEDQKHVFEVEDDGIGIETEKLCQLQESLMNLEGGFGLRNVNFRIKLQYGNAYGVYVESEYGFGTLVRIEIP